MKKWIIQIHKHLPKPLYKVTLYNFEDHSYALVKLTQSAARFVAKSL